MNKNVDLWRNSWSPVRDWQRLFEQFDRDVASNFPASRREGGDSLDFNPSCDVSETATHYKLTFDLPGVPKENIKIDLHDNYLTVSGERRQEKKDDAKGLKSHFSEVSYGSFMRSFTFPTKVDSEKVEAHYENGVLNVNIPKSAPAQARQITIN
jgi:HSP20 family protein